jgi:hypothetical protein
MRKILGKLGLLVLAVILFVLLAPPGLLYVFWMSLIRLSFRKAVGYLGNIAYSVAEGIDVLGNIVCRDLFNDTLIKPDGYQFGLGGETISSVLGKNKADATLTDLGRALANLLNWLDKNHVEESIDTIHP